MTGGGGIIGCGIVGCGIVGCGVMAGCVAAGGTSGFGITVGVGVVIWRGVESGGTGSRSVNLCGITVASAMSYGADAFGVVADDAAAYCCRWRCNHDGGETPTLSGDGLAL